LLTDLPRRLPGGLATYLRRHHLAVLALFIALGGVSYAAVKLPARSVGPRELKDRAVTLTKLDPKARKALTGKAGPAGRVGATGATGAGGLPGERGAAGAKGEPGSDGAPGARGTTGQAATTVLGTGQIQVTAATAYTLVPGLTKTVTVPADADVLVSTDGGIQNTSAAATAYAVVDVALFVDDAVTGAQRRVEMANTGTLTQQIDDWSITRTFSPGAGPHTFEVRVAGVDPGGSVANVSSASAPQLQGQLTVAILKR
jgi:hypothetical protein